MPQNSYKLAAFPKCRWVSDIADAGGNQYTFHIETVAKDELPNLCESIRAHKMRVGVAIKPGF